MATGEGIERRVAQRFTPSDDVFLVVRPSFKILGRLKDISSTGLGFEYLTFDKQSKKSSMVVDVFSSDGSKLYMSHIPVKVVYDVKIEKMSFEGFETRRCGVQFKPLSEPQTDQLHLMLRNSMNGQTMPFSA